METVDTCIFLLPCIQEIDTLVKEIVHLDSLQQNGDHLIKISTSTLGTWTLQLFVYTDCT